MNPRIWISAVTLIFCAGLAVNLVAAPRAPSVEFTLKGDSSEFMKNVGRSCLSTPDSKIEDAGPGRLRVTDDSSACAREIQSLATTWNQNPKAKLAAVHAPDESKKMLRNRIQAHYTKGLSVTASRSCPCIVLKGADAEEAAQFALYAR